MRRAFSVTELDILHVLHGSSVNVNFFFVGHDCNAQVKQLVRRFQFKVYFDDCELCVNEEPNPREALFCFAPSREVDRSKIILKRVLSPGAVPFRTTRRTALTSEFRS